MKKPVTLKDIARATGVHVSTVSRALATDAPASLSEEVVGRIKAAAREMGYRPNRLAAGLRTRRTMSVGVMIPDIANTLFPPMVRGVESVLEPKGYASILVNTDNAPEREARLFDVLYERGVDGIIDAAVQHDDPRLSQIARDVPMVTINRKIADSAVPSVVSDDVGGVRMMVQHLATAGHRAIGHIAGPEGLSTSIARRLSFVASMADAGLPEGPIAVSGRYSEAEGARCADALLQDHSGLTALLCANDRLALGALETLRQRGLNCPGDVSVTGFNGIPFLDLITPGLTTIQILQFEIGAMAADLLLKQMTQSGAQIPPTTTLPVSLIERASVAPPRAMDEDRSDPAPSPRSRGAAR